MTQHSEASEAQTHGLSVSNQALYHWATMLPEGPLYRLFMKNHKG